MMKFTKGLTSKTELLSLHLRIILCRDVIELSLKYVVLFTLVSDILIGLVGDVGEPGALRIHLNNHSNYPVGPNKVEIKNWNLIEATIPELQRAHACRLGPRLLADACLHRGFVQPAGNM